MVREIRTGDGHRPPVPVPIHLNRAAHRSGITSGITHLGDGNRRLHVARCLRTGPQGMCRGQINVTKSKNVTKSIIKNVLYAARHAASLRAGWTRAPTPAAAVRKPRAPRPGSGASISEDSGTSHLQLHHMAKHTGVAPWRGCAYSYMRICRLTRHHAWTCTTCGLRTRNSRCYWLHMCTPIRGNSPTVSYLPHTPHASPGRRISGQLCTAGWL